MKALSIYSDAKGRAQLEKALSLRSDITLCRSFEDLPDPETLACALRAWAPGILFLDLRHPGVEGINHMLIDEFPAIRKVAIHPSQTPDVFRRLLHLGMCELVNPPFEAVLFDPVIDRLMMDLLRNPIQVKLSCRICAFLPAKAGAGASTLAAHASWAAGENPEERVLLADFDCHSGITSFQFDVQATYTVQDALAAGNEIDEDLWRRMVHHSGNIDLLLSRPGMILDLGPEASAGPLLQFAHRHYSSIHVDLPDSLDPLTLSVLHQADQVFLVTTPDLAALRLARLKANALRKLDLQARTHLVVNRMTPNGLTLDEISRGVGMDVFGTLPSDYGGVCESIRLAKPNPALTRRSKDLIAKTIEAAAAPPPQRKHKFIERISVPLASYL